MSDEVRDRQGYLRQCAHAVGDITICSLCLLREADAVDLRMAKTLAETLDLRASLIKARRTTKKTQAELARAMGVQPSHLSAAKNGNRPLPQPALKWLTTQGYLVMRKNKDVA